MPADCDLALFSVQELRGIAAYWARIDAGCAHNHRVQVGTCTCGMTVGIIDGQPNRHSARPPRGPDWGWCTGTVTVTAPLSGAPITNACTAQAEHPTPVPPAAVAKPGGTQP